MKTKPQRSKIYADSHYLPPLRDLAVKPGTFTYVAIAHDSWCDLIQGRGFCNCHPEVVQREITDLADCL